MSNWNPPYFYMGLYLDEIQAEIMEKARKHGEKRAKQQELALERAKSRRISRELGYFGH